MFLDAHLLLRLYYMEYFNFKKKLEIKALSLGKHD
jgi:hypothetical protein